MNDTTNKTLLTAIVVVGVIIALMIIPLYPKSGVSFSNRNLGATAYYTDDSFLPSLNNRYMHLTTNYPVSAFRTSNTRTITTDSYTIPTTQSYTYTTYQTEGDYSTTTSYNNQGYIPAGCESGTDYSLTTGEPCG